jgi:hypothetical protein
LQRAGLGVDRGEFVFFRIRLRGDDCSTDALCINDHRATTRAALLPRSQPHSGQEVIRFNAAFQQHAVVEVRFRFRGSEAIPYLNLYEPETPPVALLTDHVFVRGADNDFQFLEFNPCWSLIDEYRSDQRRVTRLFALTTARQRVVIRRSGSANASEERPVLILARLQEECREVPAPLSKPTTWVRR